MKIDAKIREKIVKMQKLQQQLELLMYQKQSVDVNVAEIDNAIKELKGEEDEEVFEVVGNIMLKRKSSELKEKLSEKKDVTEIRKKSLQKQIDKLTKKMQGMREDINEQVSSQKKKKE